MTWPTAFLGAVVVVGLVALGLVRPSDYSEAIQAVLYGAVGAGGVMGGVAGLVKRGKQKGAKNGQTD